MPSKGLNIVPPDLWPWLLIAAGAISLGVILLLITLLLRQRDPKTDRSRHVTPAQQRTLERDVSNLIAALSEMAQEVGTRLDERAIRLEKLIREADELANRLERLPREAPEPARVSPAPPETDSRHVEIDTLADQGRAMTEIAQRLSRPKGEVELILALRPSVVRGDARARGA